MNRTGTTSSLLALALALAAPIPAAFADTPPAPAATPVAAPLSALVAQVSIPYEQFKLANGLTVLVHTDRKAPIVGVTTYFHVGSKNEPRGKTGFAHLYEHLFFSGSPNAPSFDVPLEAAGGENNGSTWYDRTNYVDTAPKGALDLMLFLESDRMGHLLGAVDQAKLDKQRGVVENEKRQGDNQPYGLSRYAIGDGLLPVGHPYRHSTIGSMADLDAATLPDVRQWFIDHYAPNNAVLVLTGDVDMATARPLVEKYFGWIARGPAIAPVKTGPVTLAAPMVSEMTDQVAMLRLTRAWTGPGVNDPDSAALEIGLRVLGGLSSSRLDNALVRGKQLAVSVSADREDHEALSFLEATMNVRPGVDRAVAEAAFDAEITRLIKEGPSADEVRRAATRAVAEQISALEEVGGSGGKGATLAEGLVYSGDPAHYAKELAEISAVTPAQVQAALAKWLGRPPLRLAITPGERKLNGDTLGGWGDEASHPAPPVDAKKPVPPIPAGPLRAAPPVAPVDALAFPAIERTRLSNGIEVALARRTAVPTVTVSMVFDAGVGADAQDTPGAQNMMLAMLDEGIAGPGVRTRTATEIAEEQERLGATITAGATIDTSMVNMSALSANLAPSLALMADLVEHPAMAEPDVTRVRQQRLAQIAATQTNPQARAIRLLNPLLFGEHHPYAQPGDGLGTVAAVTAQTPASLRAIHDKWLRPDLARITVVGDVTMAQLKPLLEAALGSWKAPMTPPPTKPISAAIPAPRARIVLVDRPHSPQSVIVGGRVLPLAGRDQGKEALDLANDVLGGDFISRLNSDLREDKGWSYGVQTLVRSPVGPRSLVVFAPVQTDKTGASLAAILADMKAYSGAGAGSNGGAKGTSPEELQRATDGSIRALPGRFETNAAVLGAIQANALLGRPDDYYVTLPQRFRSIDAARIDTAARDWLAPDGVAFVVVGDRAAVEPQLKVLGLPVEIQEEGK
jgi:predicted Zn-dependent peptidase